MPHFNRYNLDRRKRKRFQLAVRHLFHYFPLLLSSKNIYDRIFEIYPTIPNNVEDVIYNNYIKVITPLLDTIQKWNSENINNLQEVRIPNNFLSRKQIVDYILSSFILQ